MRFSQRKGLKPIRCEIQVESIDEELRNALWDVIYMVFHECNDPYSNYRRPMTTLYERMWHLYFKEPLDTIRDPWSRIRNIVLRDDWFEVYDLIEFIAQNFPVQGKCETFTDLCNQVLERELSCYRFVGETLTEITTPEEIAEIEQAINLEDSKLAPVCSHLKLALTHLSDRKNPNYRDSIKESISAVEAMCSIIDGKKATLGSALKIIKDKIGLHTALEEGFSKLYGYASNADGIRHALLDESNLDFEDAKFMLVACSGFVNYLVVKGHKAGIL